MARHPRSNSAVLHRCYSRCCSSAVVVKNGPPPEVIETSFKLTRDFFAKRHYQRTQISSLWYHDPFFAVRDSESCQEQVPRASLPLLALVHGPPFCFSGGRFVLGGAVFSSALQQQGARCNSDTIVLLQRCCSPAITASMAHHSVYLLLWRIYTTTRTVWGSSRPHYDVI